MPTPSNLNTRPHLPLLLSVPSTQVTLSPTYTPRNSPCKHIDQASWRILSLVLICPFFKVQFQAHPFFLVHLWTQCSLGFWLAGAFCFLHTLWPTWWTPTSLSHSVYSNIHCNTSAVINPLQENFLTLVPKEMNVFVRAVITLNRVFINIWNILMEGEFPKGKY